MSEVSDLFSEADLWFAKRTMRETLRRAMKLTQDVYLKTGSPVQKDEPDTIDILTESLAQLTIARDLLSDLIKGTITIQRDRISAEVAQNTLDTQENKRSRG